MYYNSLTEIGGQLEEGVCWDPALQRGESGPGPGHPPAPRLLTDLPAAGGEALRHRSLLAGRHPPPLQGPQVGRDTTHCSVRKFFKCMGAKMKIEYSGRELHVL